MDRVESEWMQRHTFTREVTQVEASGGDCFRHPAVNVRTEPKLPVFPTMAMLIEARPSKLIDVEYPGDQNQEVQLTHMARLGTKWAVGRRKRK